MNPGEIVRANSGLEISQSSKPLFDLRLIGPIQVGGVPTEQLLQQENHEFVHAAEPAAKLLFGGSSQIGRKSNFTRFAHHGPLSLVVGKLHALASKPHWDQTMICV